MRRARGFAAAVLLAVVVVPLAPGTSGAAGGFECTIAGTASTGSPIYVLPPTDFTLSSGWSQTGQIAGSCAGTALAGPTTMAVSGTFCQHDLPPPLDVVPGCGAGHSGGVPEDVFALSPGAIHGTMNGTLTDFSGRSCSASGHMHFWGAALYGGGTLSCTSGGTFQTRWVAEIEPIFQTYPGPRVGFQNVLGQIQWMAWQV